MNGSGYLFDTNIWITLAFASHSHHRQAADAARKTSAKQSAVFCRATQQSFLRLATTPKILHYYGAKALTNRDALAILNRFLALPTVSFLEEPPGTVAHWHRLASCGTASPKLWMDAYLAGFAMAGGLRIVTLDQAFKQFKGLDLAPLAKA